MNQFKFLHVVIIVSEGKSHVVLSVLLMHTLDPQFCQFNVQPITPPPPPPCPLIKFQNRDTPSKMKEFVDSFIMSGLV